MDIEHRLGELFGPPGEPVAAGGVPGSFLFQDSTPRVRTPEVQWITSLDRKTVHYISESLGEVWKIRVEDVIRDPAMMLRSLRPEHAERVRKKIAREVETGKLVTEREEYTIVRGDGVERRILTRYFLVEYGGEKQVNAIATDISDSLEASRKILDENRVLRARDLVNSRIINQVSEGVIVTDAEGRITLWNDGAEAQYGYRREEAVGQQISLILPEDRTISVDYIFFYLEEKELYETEIQLRDKEGGQRHVHLAVYPILEGLEDSTGLVWCSRDITARRRAEIRAARLQSQLVERATETTLAEIMSHVVHEVSQPITTIANHAYALQTGDRWTREEVTLVLDKIYRQAMHAGDVLKRIRMQITEGKFSLERVQVNEVIHDAIGLMREGFHRHEINVREELRSDLPEVFGDRVQLCQVVLNLLQNAQEALLERKPRRSIIRVRTRTGDGKSVIVEVADNGSPLPSDDPEKIFNSFYSSKPRGMGVGLAISRTIVEGFSGKFWVDDDPAEKKICFEIPS